MEPPIKTMLERWPALFTEREETEVIIRRTVVLRGIPVLLGENLSEFFKESDKNNFEHIPVGILTVSDGDSPHCSSVIPVHSGSTFIIIEGGIVMDDVRDLPLAVCLVFGLSYALHLDYMKNTFNFIQQVTLDLGSKSLNPKLQTLKNQLFA
ncbi:hypothetical protein KOW79_021450 [Hemibagrus wyckioides]|uniref:Uncharacterized protein n=2 Tax=Hemibagrus wyckioides TaxID=337641 RepID=A0A9D3N6M8_9TELE|nr:hypothetical protein KOW79_021450 [Hemibagrus wyckioides]